MLQVQAELQLAIDHGKGLSEQVARLEVTLSATRSELESTRRSRDRALDAAVKIRREFDAQLSKQQAGDNQTGTDPE
jgi:hypothetical protein